MPVLSDLFSVDLLRVYREHGYVSQRVHPTLPLAILNYTPKTAYEDHWDEVTRQCRGLIYSTATGEVVARPWKKFFNGDLSQPTWDEATLIEVTEKVDGSLGILYPDASQPTGYAVATRGSFTSPQAKHATASYQKSHRLFRPRPHITYLFEIVYPDNRIVVNYGQDDNLYLLGMVDKHTGEYFSPRHPSIDIPRTRVLNYQSYGIFTRNFRHQNHGEGVVVRNLLTGEMLKFKRPEYVEQHRLVFGLNAVKVWEVAGLADYEQWNAFLAPLPEDIQTWAGGVAQRMITRAVYTQCCAQEEFDLIVTTMGEDGYCDAMDEREKRKGFASYAVGSAYSALLFKLWDKQDISEACWKLVKPSGTEKPRSEDW